jgi:hypothetical protein
MALVKKVLRQPFQADATTPEFDGPSGTSVKSTTVLDPKAAGSEAPPEKQLGATEGSTTESTAGGTSEGSSGTSAGATAGAGAQRPVIRRESRHGAVEALIEKMMARPVVLNGKPGPRGFRKAVRIPEDCYQVLLGLAGAREVPAFVREAALQLHGQAMTDRPKVVETLTFGEEGLREANRVAGQIGNGVRQFHVTLNRSELDSLQFISQGAGLTPQGVLESVAFLVSKEA